MAHIVILHLQAFAFCLQSYIFSPQSFQLTRETISLLYEYILFLDRLHQELLNLFDPFLLDAARELVIQCFDDSSVLPGGTFLVVAGVPGRAGPTVYSTAFSFGRLHFLLQAVWTCQALGTPRGR